MIFFVLSRHDKGMACPWLCRGSVPTCLQPLGTLTMLTMSCSFVRSVEVGSLSLYLPGLIHPRWLFGIFSTNSVFVGSFSFLLVVFCSPTSRVGPAIFNLRCPAQLCVVRGSQWCWCFFCFQEFLWGEGEE